MCDLIRPVAPVFVLFCLLLALSNSCCELDLPHTIAALHEPKTEPVQTTAKMISGNVTLKVGVHKFASYHGEAVGNAELRVRINGQFIGASSVSDCGKEWWHPTDGERQCL